MVRYPFSTNVDIYKRAVRTQFPTAKLKSTGMAYYIQCDDNTILGSHSLTPDWAWRTAAKHVRCM